MELDEFSEAGLQRTGNVSNGNNDVKKYDIFVT